MLNGKKKEKKNIISAVTIHIYQSKQFDAWIDFEMTIAIDMKAKQYIGKSNSRSPQTQHFFAIAQDRNFVYVK